jgi:hypothetical protein
MFGKVLNNPNRSQLRAISILQTAVVRMIAFITKYVVYNKYQQKLQLMHLNLSSFNIKSINNT